MVIPPEYVPDRASGGRLPRWTGTPFDEQNLGATLTTRDVFCTIGDPDDLEARILVEQQDDSLVQLGKPVEVVLNQYAWKHYETELTRYEGNPIEFTPSRLSSLQGGEVPTQMNKSGTPVPLTPHYRYFAPLESDGYLRVGLTGTAKIETRPFTIAQRLYRYAARTFNFDL